MDTIIFDVDDTLYDQADSFRKTCRKMLSVSLSDDELNRLYMISRKYSDALFDEQVAGKITKKEMHIRRIKDACIDFNIEMTEKEAIDFQAAYVAEQQNITLFNEVKNLLDFLIINKKQVAVLTNGATDHQAMKIKQLNLAKWIPKENLFISETVGYAKPSEKAFAVLEEKLRLKKDKTVYVGDSFANDIVGAKQAGWQAVWMNHRRRKKPEGKIEADKTVNSATELYNFFRNGWGRADT